jgi:tripartite motif-containing protein 71
MVQALLSFKKKGKRGLSLKIICLLFFLTLHNTSAGLAGDFTFEKEWGFICPSFFGCPAPQGFWGSSAIVYDPAGILYVFDVLNARIHKYDTDGNFQGHLTACPDGNPQLEDYCTGEGEVNYSPSMALSPGGDFVYVSDPRSLRIHKFAADGTWILSWGNAEDIPVAFREPSGVTVDVDGDVYVTDILGSAIFKFDPNGGLLDRWTHPYASGNDFRPTAIFASDEGIYVTDYQNSVLYKFSYNGKIRDSIGGFDGTAPGEFTYPADVAVDVEGNIFVADTLNNRIQALSDGWAAHDGGIEEGDLDRPFGIAADDEGNVYVSDTFNNRVLKYSYTP